MCGRMGIVIEEIKVVSLTLRWNTDINEEDIAEVDKIVKGVCGSPLTLMIRDIRYSVIRADDIDKMVRGVFGFLPTKVTHDGRFSGIRVECEDGYPNYNENPAEEVEAELIKAFKEKGYEVIS